MQIERQLMEQSQGAKHLLEFSLEESNRIQSELLVEEFGGTADEWVSKNLEQFRERSKQFKEVIMAHSELISLYRQKPEEFKKRIKELLNKNTTLH